MRYSDYNCYLDKCIKHLRLKPEFNSRDAVREAMLKTFGSYDKRHYAKYFLDNAVESCFSNENAKYLALRELTNDELDEIKSRGLLVQFERIEPSKYYLSNCASALCLDYEEDKYDYYALTEHVPHSPVGHSYSVRVAKQ